MAELEPGHAPEGEGATRTLHRARLGAEKGVTIIYLHGGGLLYGSRDDLPAPYARLLTGAGYDLCCLDYPLAPETPLPSILDELEGDIAGMLADGSCRGSYVLFGRSAGAYLALVLARRLGARGDVPSPLGVIDFYGYTNLLDPRLAEPSAHYLELAPISEDVAMRHVGEGHPTTGSLDDRFLLYVWARQTGAWMRLLGAGTDEVRRGLSLDDDDLRALPPVFATASSADQDVPFTASRDLRRLAPSVEWHPVYYLEHDFDRDVTNPVGRETYERCVAWLDALPRP